MSITKLASGWVSDRLPGRFFRTKSAAMVALAWSDVQNLLSDKAKDALRGGGYAGEKPIIEALVDSIAHWKSVGDMEKAQQAKAKKDELLSTTKAPAAPQAPTAHSTGLTTKPSTKTKGWVQVMDNGADLIELPPDIANDFVAQYQQAKGDAELEEMIYKDFYAKARPAGPDTGLTVEEFRKNMEEKKKREQEDAAKPQMRQPASLGGDDNEPVTESFELGDMRIEAKTQKKWFPVQEIDKKTGRPKTTMRERIDRSFEVFHPSKEVPIYRFWMKPDGNFSVKSNTEGKTKEVQPKVFSKSETIDAIKAKNPSFDRNTKLTDVELKSIATELGIKPVYREQWDARVKPQVVPDWTSHDAMSPEQVSKALTGFVPGNPSAASVMGDVMNFLGVKKMASTNVVIKIASDLTKESQLPPRGPGFFERKIMEAMDDAEEMGGPEGHEYVAMMERIAAEALKRADNAKAILKTSPILGTQEHNWLNRG